LLVGDDLLCEPAHLWVFAIKQLCFRHVDRGLMMGKHQSGKINVALAG
jgi:hypothetical protein